MFCGAGAFLDSASPHLQHRLNNVKVTLTQRSQASLKEYDVNHAVRGRGGDACNFHRKHKRLPVYCLTNPLIRD